MNVNEWKVLFDPSIFFSRVWNLNDFGEQAEKLLPHPAFVYCAQFHPRVDTVVVTGGFDQVIRIWDISGEEPHGDVSTVKFLNFRTPENVAVTYLKFKQRDQPLGYCVKKMQME